MLIRMPVIKKTFLQSPLKLYFLIIFFSVLVIPIAINLSVRSFSLKPQSKNDLQIIKELGKDACFPIPKNFSYKYINDYGKSRKVEDKVHSHQGIDIMAERNTPAIAIEDCIIEKIGWDKSGGNRINMVSLDGKRRYYYAHFEKFFPGLTNGSHVKKGSILGYIGSSGYGPSGSDTGAPPHLHIQIWAIGNNEDIVNPYPILKWLEKK